MKTTKPGEKKEVVNKLLSQLLENERLDFVLEGLLKFISWDDLMLAFSNLCVFEANKILKLEQKENKDFKSLMKKAKIFHDMMENQGTVFYKKK